MNHNGRYILENGKPVPCEDLFEWARWFEKTKDRHIGDTRQGKVRVSTVFLGLDHSFSGRSKPILFETMVFGGLLDQSQDRYSTLEEAQKGHKKWCKKAFLIKKLDKQ